MNDQSIAPVLIGGVGGSGTRVVAELLMAMGFFLGDNLNKSNDFMGSSLMPEIRKLMHRYSVKTNKVINHYINTELLEIKRVISSGFVGHSTYCGWGWKIPTNFFILNNVNTCFPEARYVHVIRHGLDMAYSSNQNQLHNWGFYFNVFVKNYASLAHASLKYWLEANHYAINQGILLMSNRFHVVNYDDLCDDPLNTIAELARFLKVDQKKIKKLATLIHPSASRLVCRQERAKVFSQEDIDAVQAFGFVV
jgi:hypothetical protein